MAQIDRFSVSLDAELLAAFDRHIAAKGYDNRSEAIRDLIRDLLITSRLKEGNDDVSAILTAAVVAKPDILLLEKVDLGSQLFDFAHR